MSHHEWKSDIRRMKKLARLARAKGRGFDMGFGPGGLRFNFDFDGHGPGRHRHRHRGEGGGRRRMFDSGELRLVLLALIAEEPRHGYDLIRALEEKTGGGYSPSPGTVYPTLTLLEEMGFIEEAKAKGKKKPFAITDDGTAYLEAKADDVARLMERLERHGEHRERAGSQPIKASIKHLMTAFWQKISQDGADEETIAEIARILDKAARKIEKI
ncbi:PadR family transcriptional regulator [Sphingomicrobium nitratireducens]|uniref:PadR family transcriptional regulator n=1 Tax=Sphingomicrobium nitratireducens TaxID=2964666 RepID=UPI0022404D94|nr:PadR family transcriptional regulator [Sphingomicrobium nitratireducens]